MFVSSSQNFISYFTSKNSFARVKPWWLGTYFLTHYQATKNRFDWIKCVEMTDCLINAPSIFIFKPEHTRPTSLKILESILSSLDRTFPLIKPNLSKNVCVCVFAYKLARTMARFMTLNKNTFLHRLTFLSQTYIIQRHFPSYCYWLCRFLYLTLIPKGKQQPTTREK